MSRLEEAPRATRPPDWPSLDRRTKSRSDLSPVSVDALVAQVGGELEHRNGELAARAQELLGLPALTVEVEGRACTFDRGALRPGRSPGAVVARLDSRTFSEVVSGWCSTHGLIFGSGLLEGGSRVEVAPREAGWLLGWEPVLRALFDGRPLYEPGSMAFESVDGTPLDLGRTFLPDDDDADIAHFLVEAGFLHLRGWVDQAALEAVAQEVAAAAAGAARDTPYRMWARLDDGSDRCIRVMHLLEVCDSMAQLVTGETYRRLENLLEDGHRRFPDQPQSTEALIKPLGVAEGMADLPWHRDCSLGGHQFRCAGYAVGLPLTATGEEEGHLRVIPGSHRASLPAPGEVPSYDTALPVLDVLTQPGDLTVHVSCILHSTVAPRSAERAVVYTTFALTER